MESDESTSRPLSNVSIFTLLSRTIKIKPKVENGSKSTKLTNGTLAFVFLFLVFIGLVIGLLVSLSAEKTENGFAPITRNQTISTTILPSLAPINILTTTEDDPCGNQAWIGDGFCDDVSNHEECFFDGGDCCLESISIGTCYTCLCHLDGKLHHSADSDDSEEETEEDNFLFMIGDAFKIPPHVHDLKTNQIYTLPLYPYSCQEPYGFFTNHSVVVCGGVNCDSWGGIPIVTKRCYRLEGYEWVLQDFETIEARRFLATVEIQNKLWILGGSNDNFDGLQSSEFLTSSGTSSGPTLPEKVESHCVTSLSETKVMIIGGEIPHFVDGKDASRYTYLYDFDAKQWRSGPAMSAKRVNPGCTSFIHNNKVIVIVAGGQGSSGPYQETPYYDSSELLFPETEDGWDWIQGPTLPIKVNAPAMVTLDDTVYLLGGSIQLEHPMITAVDSIYQLQTYPDYEWIQSNKYLKVARSHFKVFKVPGEYIRDSFQVVK